MNFYHYTHLKIDISSVQLCEIFFMELWWLLGSAPDFCGRGPGFDSGFSLNDLHALQDHCVIMKKTLGWEGNLPLRQKKNFNFVLPQQQKPLKYIVILKASNANVCLINYLVKLRFTFTEHPIIKLLPFYVHNTNNKIVFIIMWLFF